MLRLHSFLTQEWHMLYPFGAGDKHYIHLAPDFGEMIIRKALHAGFGRGKKPDTQPYVKVILKSKCLKKFTASQKLDELAKPESFS